ncbi:MAG: DMT family transporter [Bacillota bacterium]|nr:DMT family transporter [Bacillota bacterium]
MNRSKFTLVSAMLIFGSVGLFVRSIPFTSSQIALVRGIIGGLFLFISSFVFSSRLSWPRIKSNLLLLIFSGLALGLNWIFLFQAYKYTTISNATIGYYCAPIFVIFLAPILLKERLHLHSVLSIVAAMVGMFLVVGIQGGSSGGTNILGIAYALLAASLYAAVILLNKFQKNLTGLESSFMQLGISAVFLLPYVLLNEGFNLHDVSFNSVLLLLTVGVLHTGIAYLLYFSSIHKLKSQTAAAFSYIDPISAILMSSILLHESMTILQGFGAVLILGAAFLNEICSRKYISAYEV